MPEPQLKAWTSWVSCRGDICCTTPPHCLAPVSRHNTQTTASVSSTLNPLSLPSITTSSLSPLTDGNSQLPSCLVPRSDTNMHPTPPSIPPPSSSNHTPDRAKPPSTWGGRSCYGSHPTPFPSPSGESTGGEQVHPANLIAAIALPQCPPSLVSIPLAFSSHPPILPAALQPQRLISEQIFSVPPISYLRTFSYTTQQRSYLPSLILS